jgi:hypothetical protein
MAKPASFGNSVDNLSTIFWKLFTPLPQTPGTGSILRQIAQKMKKVKMRTINWLMKGVDKSLSVHLNFLLELQ